MIRIRTALAFSSLLLLAACAPRRPIVDERTLIEQAAMRKAEFKTDMVDATRAVLMRVVQETGDERTIDIDAVDKARTVFEWGPKPKPGKGPGNTKHKKTAQPTDRSPQPKTTNKEKQKS